jgi:hypothetical protein
MIPVIFGWRNRDPVLVLLNPLWWKRVLLVFDVSIVILISDWING